ncbi:MAG: hypothetical protein RMJ33_02750 [Saprospiraceae bacterium]|nr:hypothetical protein [Saprospiraceae bacterium]MDW8228736.1 hypothetical protein [Saprospiraceae bacterium]
MRQLPSSGVLSIFAGAMVRRFLVFALTISILGQAFVRTVVVLHYHWNRQAYAERCENANRPELDCFGKCYLKKRIAALENRRRDDRQSLPAFFLALKDIPLFWESALVFALMPFCEETALIFPPWSGSACEGHATSVFHPPC